MASSNKNTADNGGCTYPAVVICIDIDRSDDDAKPAASEIDPLAVTTVANNRAGLRNRSGLYFATQANTAVINLCNDFLLDAMEVNATPQVYQRHRKRAGDSTELASKKVCPDAYVIDGIDTNTSSLPNTGSEEDPSTRYRQVLGPLRMKFVESFSSMRHVNESGVPIGKLDVNALYKELLEFQINLPVEFSSAIFVRSVESRLDLVRAMITGPEGTPYENGCFFFDIWMNDYPQSPPKVKFLTTGGGTLRFNPNLYSCGKVCLSLLGTWSGPGWIPMKSTLLQVLVSIQGLIFVPDPYFNEPGYHDEAGNKYHIAASKDYSNKVRTDTLEHAMLPHLQQLHSNTLDFPEFELALTNHFLLRADAIRVQLAKLADAISALEPMVRKMETALEIVGAKNRPRAHPTAGPHEVVTVD